MKKIYTFLIATLAFTCAWGQNPGMIISEFYQNPPSSDSPYEYVELLATADIDFSVTPYTIIVSNNGTGTVNGWIEGGVTTYAFEISTGTVSIGDVVYVGGSLMAPTGTILRSIDTGTENGDGGVGNANAGGVFGNGGGNGDGIAVFNLPIASITADTEPTDAIIYGTGIGGAEVGPGEGYQLPNNDYYSGGKLTAASYYAPDEDLTMISGEFDLATNEFTVARTFTDGSGSDGVSEITFAEVVSPKLSFLIEDLTVNEADGTIDFEVEMTFGNDVESSANIVIMGSSTAGSPSDFILVDTAIVFPSGFVGTQVFSIEIQEDVLEEQSEYITITMADLVNAELDGITELFLYITDNDRILPSATNELKLDLLTSFSTGVEEESSAEIVVFDTTSTRLFVANSIANTVDIVDFSDPSVPVLIDAINLDSLGFINSVAVYNGLVALAVQAPVAQDSGYVVLFDTDGIWLNRLTVGALPDMVTFNHAGTQLIVACEGEPSADYLVDPNGGISIIEVTMPYAEISAAAVTNLDFTAYNGMEADLNADGIRIFGPGATASQDIEPEYVTVLDNDVLAYVVLQENNAIARVDLISKSILDIIPLGTIDHSLYGFGLDASNQTSGINIANFPIHGMFMPDAIDQIQIGGIDYLVTANEGDSRDYDGFSEEERVDDLTLDPVLFENATYLQNSMLLGRLKTTSATGDIDEDGDIDIIHTYGTRSFTIWDEATGARVFDSGDLFEQILANDPFFVNLFNADNEGGSITQKNRSDDKGPEPEGVKTAFIDGNAFLFVSLERVGGVFVFNINDPANPNYIGYHNNRDLVSNGPDRGAEGMIFIPADISPNGNGILILANEVSSTLTIYEVNSCQEVSDLMVSSIDGSLQFCENDSLQLIASSSDELDLEWLLDGSSIPGETEDNYFAMDAGFYQVSFINELEGCSGKTDSLTVVMNALPLVEAFVSADSICFGESVVFTSEGAMDLVWDTDGVVNDEAFIPTETGLKEYTVLGTAENGCENTASVSVNMAEPIVITFTTLDEVFGSDAEIDLNVSGGFGAYVYDWDLDELGDFDDDEDLIGLEGGTYTVVVLDEFGCFNESTIEINSQVGLSENKNLVGLSVYPNPTAANLNIVLEGDFQYSLINVNGQTIVNGKANNTVVIAMADFANGIYFMEIVSVDDKKQTVKVVKF